MFDGSDPCWIPRAPVQDQSKQRMRIAQFGDGYQQRTGDGINALELRWTLTWDTKPGSDLVGMNAYLAARKGAAFPFQHPVTLVDYIVFCDEWQITWEIRRNNVRKGAPQNFGTLSAEFYEANGVTVTVLP